MTASKNTDLARRHRRVIRHARYQHGNHDEREHSAAPPLRGRRDPVCLTDLHHAGRLCWHSASGQLAPAVLADDGCVLYFLCRLARAPVRHSAPTRTRNAR